MATAPDDGYVLFFGTLEPRKNVTGLLDAYERIVTRRPSFPPLVLAGKALQGSARDLGRLQRAPLAGRARHVGYVDPSDRRSLYAGALLLVQPSFDEGFGLPVLEAMTLGLPVVASNRGALPEVLGGAGVTVDATDSSLLADAIERLVDDDARRAEARAAGIRRAQHYSWERTARSVYEAYVRAVERRTSSAPRAVPA
jgi:alpha-1,3-rhamnosyl/mannosyltransferase